MLNLNLTTASGAMYPIHEQHQRTNGPVMEGFLNFPLGKAEEGKKQPKLETVVSAWVVGNEKPYYSLSIGGINGALFKQDGPKKSEKDADYTGKFGPNNELRIAGWKKHDEKGEYISLSVSVPKPKPNAGDQKASASAQHQRASSIL